MAGRLASPLAGRRRWWLFGLGLLLALRAALPVVLRAVLAARASEALQARVEIGDVDLALLRGGIALEEVAVRPAAGAGESEPPLVSWKRLAANLRWLSLPRRTIRLESVLLDSPFVALDRLESGDLNLAALVPATPAEPADVEPPPAARPWDLGIDRFVLRDGSVRFRDLTFPNLEPVEVAVHAIEVAEIALRPGVYGQPSRLRLAVKIDDGRLRLDGRLAPKEEGFVLETKIRARHLPLPRTRVYVPDVGWSDLRGQVSATIAHRFETEVRNEARGEVVLTDLAVRVPDLDEPVLAWQRLAMYLDRLDLVGQRVAVRTVDVHGAAVAMRPAHPVLLPLLEARAAKAEERAAAVLEAPPAKPWHWSVESVAMRDSHVHLLGPDGAVDVGVTLGARELADDAERPSPVELKLVVGPGSLGADGSLRLDPPGFAGTVTIDQLPLPELVVAAGALPPGLLRTARLGAELAIALGSLAPTAGDVDVRGRLALAEPSLAAADPNDFGVGAQAIELAIEELRVPGVLGANDGAVPAGPIHLRLQEFRLDQPTAQLTRTAEGLVLPSFATAPEGGPADPPPASAPPPAAPADAAAAATTPPAAGPPLDLAVTTLHLTGGRIAVTDRTVTPYYQGGLAPLDLEVRKLRWPELAMNRLRFTATNLAGGTIEVTGALGPTGGQLQVNSRRLALQPFNPHATTYSPYSISSGWLSLTTKVSYGKGRYAATSAITLHDFDLGSRAGDSLFQEQFGIPLSMALALLRDVEGKIVLDLPVEADEKGTKVGLATLIGGALRRALLNALASPLKLVGAVMGGGAGQTLAPAPIGFQVGRDAPAPEGEQQVAQLATFLASRPGIGVTLAASLSTRDVRWLREQALREELAAPQGMVGALRTFGERGARDRIRTALDARGRDQAGDLAPEDAETLERWLAERPPPTPERLRALAEARVARVESLLRERHGIGAERIARRDPPAEVTDTPPAVQVELGAARVAGSKAPAP